MIKNEIPFNIKNIGYEIRWSDYRDGETEGYTLLRKIQDVSKAKFLGTIGDWAKLNKPQPIQFSDLEGILKGTDEIYQNKNILVLASSIGIDWRYLNEKELLSLYNNVKSDLLKFNPKYLAEEILPVFYKD